MNSPAYKVLLYGTALLLVLFAFSNASAQEPWPPELGGIMRCVDGKPDPDVNPNVPVGSLAWVAYMLHETVHVTQVYRAGGCGPYEARMQVDERMRGHPYRLQTEVEAYCAERAAGFYRGFGTLAEIGIILSTSPVYRRWNWSFNDAMTVLRRVCG